MRTLNQKITNMVWFVLLCGAIQAWGYTNPIDGPTTETVTNLWDLGTDSLQVGLTTGDNALIITNGGRVESGGGQLGYGYSNSGDNRVVITGTGSMWINSGNMVLETQNNELLITDGGRLDSVGGTVGGYGAGNNLVMVSGAGSVWSNSASLQVGASLSANNTVVVTNGGHLYSSGCTVSGEQTTLNSYLVVTGPGSVYKNTGSLDVSHWGIFEVSNGGRVENTDAVLFDTIAAPATVTGSGSTWINSGQLSIVDRAELMISDGGRVESNGGQIQGGIRGPGKVTVDGVGSTWINSGHLNMGSSELMISDGGYATSDGAYVTGGSTVTVTGAGSTWNNAGALELNNHSSVTVSNGGTVSAASFINTGNPNPPYSTFHLQAGGKLNISGDFDGVVAGHFDFSGGTLSVGGTLSNFFLLAVGNRLEASDLSGDLTVHGTFAPGQSPADTLLDGAFVLAGDGTLEMDLAGYLLGAEYDRLTVTGESMLEGTLAVVLLNGFAPVYGDTFDFFNWDGGVSGTFAVTNLPTLGNGLSWDAGNLYTDGTLTVVPEPSTSLLLGIGLATFGVYALRSKVYEF